MEGDKNPIEVGRRVSRLNKCIVVLALLWIATGVALLFEVHPSYAHATQPAGQEVARPTN